MSDWRCSVAVGLVIGSLGSLGGCVIHEVSPNPSVVISGRATHIRIDTSALKDAQHVSGMLFTSVADIRKSLTNGLRNAAGDKFVESGSDAVLLKFVSLDLQVTQGLSSYIGARFRAKWIAANGELIAEVSAKAEPHNRFEQDRDRHVEDLLGVVLERAIEGYDRATRPAATPANATLP